jgi:hypothetical protein
MRTFATGSHADPDAAWRLLARPELWSRWSPHVRGAWHLGAPEVREGAVGAARLIERSLERLARQAERS